MDSLEAMIKRLEKSQLESINLSNRDLKEFPSALKTQTNLKYLYLDNNKLIFAPEIGNFLQLEELSIEENGLTLIPETYFNLKSLKCLNLNKNPLRCINNMFFNTLQNLSILWLNNCELMYLPKEIGGLKFLEKLGLKSNCLQDLPEEIGSLTSLRWLNLEKNEIGDLSDKFKNLKNLNYLNLSFNKLEKIPNYFYEMNNLNIVLVQHNQIRAFSDEDVLGLSFLNKLDISANPCIKSIKTSNDEFYKQLLCIKTFIIE
jgi:Leucine-rich repeat (LRR) protein